MAHKTSRKPRPTPLKDVQLAVQADEPRRYLVLDAHSSLPSPTYPFEQQVVPSTPPSPPLHEDHSAWQVRARVSDGSSTCTPPCVVSHLLYSLSSSPPLLRVEPSVVLSSRAPYYHWNDSLDSQDDNCIGRVPLRSLRPHRSLTPPISPPVLSPPEIDTEYSSKRSGMTFALVPAEVGGKHVFTHVVMNCRGNDFESDSGPPSGEDGLPEDMQDILRQLDDLASWVKAASSSRDCISSVKAIVHATRLTGHPVTEPGRDSTSHLSGGPLPNKGKNRLLSTMPNSVYDTRHDFVESSRGATPSDSTNIFPQSEGFIYVPNCNTPEFLVGSSNSPIAYPVCGYSSHPSRYSPLLSGPTHDIPYPRRFLEWRSVPCPSPTPPLVSPPPGRTSFKTLFQRSRCSTTTVSRPSISSGHVTVDGALRQGKRSTFTLKCSDPRPPSTNAVHVIISFRGPHLSKSRSASVDVSATIASSSALASLLLFQLSPAFPFGTVMPSRQSVPRIRVDLLDGAPRNLSPSSTLDIRDILSQVKLLPKLLAENFMFDDADGALYLEDNVPPRFPTGRRPPLFILNSHRTRLPFPIRPEAFELDDLCWNEEDASPLLTAPTVPRMKLVIKEQLYVQKWVDTLTSENPPKHIPWTCERPATEKKWIAEGSIFPAAVVKSCNGQQHLRVTETNRSSAPADQVPYSGELRALSEVSALIRLPTESHVKSADADPGIIRSESKIPQTPRRIVKTSQAPSPPTSLPSGPPIQTTSTTLDAPLAARRGKSLSGLKVKGSIIEQLEYPDIPTAFRGSPGVWSPGFDTFHVPSLTDHQSMLLNLRSKCAGLGDGVSTYIQEPPHPQAEMARTSLDIDEWAFAQGLATFDNNPSGSIDTRVPWEIIPDTNTFLPDDSSTPAKGSTARLGFVPRLHSTPALQLPANRSSDPPRDPLPPRPALISPSTPPNVRGILKKVKSVRFEDMITKELQTHTSPALSPQAPPERAPPPPSAVSSERPCTPMPNTPKPSSAPVPVKEMAVLGLQKKKPAPRSRLPPKRTKANGKHEPTHPSAGKTPETSKPTPATTSVEHPRRIAHVKENTNAVAVPQVYAKQKGLSIAETDVRRGIEGTTKSRLSTPLRNIFRFR